MSQPLVKVKSRLRDMGVSNYAVNKGEVRHLANIIHKDEKIEAFIWGVYAAGFACMVATNRRLMFIDKTFFDIKVDEIPYRMVAAVEYDVGTITSKVRVFTRAKNFSMRRVRHNLANKFSNYLEERIVEYSDSQVNNAGR